MLLLHPIEKPHLPLFATAHVLVTMHVPIRPDTDCARIMSSGSSSGEELVVVRGQQEAYAAAHLIEHANRALVKHNPLIIPHPNPVAPPRPAFLPAPPPLRLRCLPHYLFS